VGAGYQDSCHPYEVWGLNTGSEIFRYNFCGSSFDQAPGFLCQIQVSSGDIWGTECGPNVYRFNFSTLSFHQMSNLNLTQLTVGPNGMWGITVSPSGNVVQFDDEAQNFYAVGGEPATQIQAGGNGVWGISSSQQIFRLDPGTLSFVHIPGAFVFISVGTGGGAWGLDSSGKAFAITTL
jgi:Tectonin domain